MSPQKKKVFSSMYENITKIALKGIALAMSVLKTLDINTGINMLGIGLAALALANFQE